MVRPKGSKKIAVTVFGSEVRDRGTATAAEMRKAGWIHGTWKFKHNRSEGSPYIRGWIEAVRELFTDED